MGDTKIPFSLYDFWASIFPGIFLISFIVALTFPLSAITLDSVSITLLLIVAYVVGQILQGLGSILEMVYYRKGGRYPSVLYLKEEDKWFSKEFGSKLKEEISKKFGMSSDSRLQEMFDLCYRYVIQKGIGGRAEKFLSIHGFYRGMTVAASIAFISSLINIYFYYSTQNLLIAIAMLFSILIFFYQYTRFSRRFVHEVYSQFYVHVTTEK